MDFADVIGLINTNRGNGKKKNLDRMKQLLIELDHPEQNLHCIHVAGTNGKGSICAYISQILQEAGYRVGVFTSPHLERINERIQINGQQILTDDLIHLTETIQPIVARLEVDRGEKFYSFEILTAIALLYFQQQQPDIVILETGVGGRIDATNVIAKPLVSVIGSIGHDHMHVLGTDLTAIAQHKAGIIKSNCPAVIYPVQEEIRYIFADVSNELDAPLTQLDKNQVTIKASTYGQQVFDYKDWSDLMIQLSGIHQVYNAMVAVEAVHVLNRQGYAISTAQIYEGLSRTKWSGRMEQLSEQPFVLVDGAHNEEGVMMLSKSLEQIAPNKKWTLFVGMMADRNYMMISDQMGHIAGKCYVLSPDSERGFNPEQVADHLTESGTPTTVISNVQAIKQYIDTEATDDEHIVIFGSLYLVGDILTLYKKTL